MPGANPEPIRMRPWDVPEERGPGARSSFAKPRRDEREMIILDEYRSVRRGQLLVDRSRELRVDTLIRRPILWPKHGPDIHDVAQRPKPFVREPTVICGELLFLKPQAPKLVGGGLRRHPYFVESINHCTVRTTSSMRDPDAAAFAHERIQRDGYAAGCGRVIDGPVLLVIVQIRLAIGRDDQWSRST